MDTKDQEPETIFNIETKEFTYQLGITSLIKEEIQSYYWIKNADTAKLYKENIKLMDIFKEAIDLI